jgi:prephenate dehydratase
MMKVGFLGPEGTFSQEAGKLYFKKVKNARLIPYSTFYDLLIAADKGAIDEGITPVENSIEGTVGAVMDMLVKDVNLMIREEIVLPVFQYLLAQPGIKLSQITDIVSHPQAIDQSKNFIRKKLPKAVLHLSYSTADAAMRVSSSGSKKRNFAAIGAKGLTKLYGLSVIAEKINDYPDNSTRFIVLSKKDHARTGNDKTSIVFSIAKDKPGGLYDILGEFARRNINLTKVESRPSKRALGDYFFFIDLEGHRSQKGVADALSLIKKRVAFFKLLGSYPHARA